MKKLPSAFIFKFRLPNQFHFMFKYELKDNIPYYYLRVIHSPIAEAMATTKHTSG